MYTRYNRLATKDRPRRDFTVLKDSKTKEILNPDVVSQTKQSERDASDINTIVAKAIKTGVLGSGLPATRKATYADFTNGADFTQQQNQIVAIKEVFDGLEADLRNKFHNNPSEMLEYVNNPANEIEAITLGLLPKAVIEKKIEGNDTVVYRDQTEIGRFPTPKAEEAAPSVAAEAPTPAA